MNWKTIGRWVGRSLAILALLCVAAIGVFTVNAGASMTVAYDYNGPTLVSYVEAIDLLVDGRQDFTADVTAEGVVLDYDFTLFGFPDKDFEGYSMLDHTERYGPTAALWGVGGAGVGFFLLSLWGIIINTKRLVRPNR